MNWHKLFDYDPGSGYLIRNSGSSSGSVIKAVSFSRAGKPTAIVVTCKPKTFKAHRIIWEMHYGPIPEGMVIDHRDGNPLNNKIANLRCCTQKQNMRNMKPFSTNRLRRKGVRWIAHHRRFLAKITVDGKQKHLGYFLTEQEAQDAYDTAAVKEFGEFARTQ